MEVRPQTEEVPVPSEEEQERSWLLDLGGGGSGTEGFPFSLWAKLTRRVLTERGEPLRLLVRNREALAEYAEDLLRTLAEAAAENPALELVYE